MTIALLKVAEFLVLFIILIMIVKMLWSDNKKVHVSDTPENKSDWFDNKEDDICDAEYEEIK